MHQKDGPEKGEILQESDVRKILLDIDIVDTLTVEDDLKLKSDEVQKIWETNMHDFEPDDLITFVVDRLHSEIFYEEIGHEIPTQIKGTYFVQGGTNEHKIDVIVQDPDKNIVYKRSGETEGIIVFTTTTPGEYSFIFSNLGDSVYEKACSFAIHTFEEKLDALSYTFTDDNERIVVYDPKSEQNKSN